MRRKLACLFVLAFIGCNASVPVVTTGDSQAEDRMLAEAKAFLAGGGKVDDTFESYPLGPFVVCRTRLKVAAAKGYTKVVAYLLSKGADPDFEGDSSGAWTAVHWASTAQVLELLVKAGGNIRASEPAQWGRQPIHVAAMMGWPSAVQWYLDRGIEVGVTTTEGETPLHLARDVATAKVLLNAGADPNAKTIDTTRTFLGGFSMSSTPKYATPLHYAARRGNAALVDYLLTAGSATDVKDSRGRTALDFAAEGGDVETLKRLLRAAPQKDLSRLLCAAARLGNVEVCRYLLAQKADPDSANALHGAVWVGYSPPRADDLKNRAELVRLLLAAGAKVNFRDSSGQTPLLLAARSHADAGIVGLLLSAGADVSARNEEASTALHEAAGAGNMAVVELLLKHGANPDALDKDGRKPLDMVDEKEHADVKSLLRKHTK